jgi:hypothetical protein
MNQKVYRHLIELEQRLRIKEALYDFECHLFLSAAVSVNESLEIERLTLSRVYIISGILPVI